MRNIIDAILTLLKRKNFNLCAKNQNAQYVDFNVFIRDIFAGNPFLPENSCPPDNEYRKRLLENFSHLGSPNETPDAILESGDAVEIKAISCKLEGDERYRLRAERITDTDSPSGDILLNNVPPLQFLHKDSTFISKNIALQMIATM